VEQLTSGGGAVAVGEWGVGGRRVITIIVVGGRKKVEVLTKLKLHL
jgi:hypothetical protein